MLETLNMTVSRDFRPSVCSLNGSTPWSPHSWAKAVLNIYSIQI
jgi:hypothetical protein